MVKTTTQAVAQTAVPAGPAVLAPCEPGAFG